MDGVIADFVKAFNQTFEAHYPEHTPMDKIGSIKHKLDEVNPNFWDEIPPMHDAKKLMNFLADKDFEILTAYASWSPRSKHAKVKWMAKHFGVPASKIHTVLRAEKKNYAMTNGKPNILIDDYAKNIKEFRDAGGIGIHHIGATSTISKLKEILENINKIRTTNKEKDDHVG
jgi:5'(3')-deoxyribonucleotidase